MNHQQPLHIVKNDRIVDHLLVEMKPCAHSKRLRHEGGHEDDNTGSTAANPSIRALSAVGAQQVSGGHADAESKGEIKLKHGVKPIAQNGDQRSIRFRVIGLRQNNRRRAIEPTQKPYTGYPCNHNPEAGRHRKIPQPSIRPGTRPPIIPRHAPSPEVTIRALS